MMDDATTMVLLGGLAFAIPHLLLGFPPLRPRLASWLGEQRFVATFALVAALGLGVFAATLAIHGGGGGAGLGAGWRASIRTLCALLAAAGLVLAMAALGAYPRSPAALFRQGVGAPRGIEKVSRHGFFVGFGLFCVMHLLLAPTAAQAMAFGVLAAVCAVGALFQDRKLRARHGAAWDGYRRQTSVLPGLALLRGRSRIDAGDGLPSAAIRGGLMALLLAAAHPLWAIGHGAAFVGALALGGVAISARRFTQASAQAGSGR